MNRGLTSPVSPQIEEASGPESVAAWSGVVGARHRPSIEPPAATVPARAWPPPPAASIPPRGALISFGDVEPITERGRVTDYGSIPAPVEIRDRAVFLRMDGVHAGQVISLCDGEMTIGRAPGSDIVIDDTGVSRNHARLKKVGKDVFLVDVSAKNGTLVQGEPLLGQVQLRDGDYIQLGPRVAFRFSLVDEKQETLLHRLYESSNRDSLTNAYNRKHFDERLASEIAYAHRHNGVLGLIVFDIDFFKRVNDTKGHAAGDAVLKHVAGLAMSRLRSEDLFARIGGEEFAILLRGVSLSSTARLAERLRTMISASPVLFDGHYVPVTISLGCASLNELDNAGGEDLVRLADERLYRAKTSGRNRVCST